MDIDARGLDDFIVRDASGSGRIDGVIIHDLQINRDSRGTLTELLRSDWHNVCGEELPFAQVYAAITWPGVARDEHYWHVHQHQTDRFYCLAGRIVVAIADPRPDSSTHGRLMLVDMSAEVDAPAALMVTIPPRTLHGFVVVGDERAIMLNFPNRLYDPSDEGRISFEEARVVLLDGSAFAHRVVRRLLNTALVND